MTSDFYSSLPVITEFSSAVRPENHVPLPNGWVIGHADVVGSTIAIEEGRYKAVNMVGAGVIAAIANALNRRPFPFIFGGDGASFAVDISDAQAAADALQAIAAYSEAEFDLKLRVAMAPVAVIRTAGRDVCVTRYQASADCIYAMFSGGGLSWFAARVKEGQYLLKSMPENPLPDLSGLTCRWALSPAQHGKILSAIIAPFGTENRFSELIDHITLIVSQLENSGNPVAMPLLQPGPEKQAVELEALAKATGGISKWSAKIRARLLYWLTCLCFRTRPKLAGRDMNIYMESLSTNADFRKFDDALYLTIDCSDTFVTEFESLLIAASDYIRYGIFCQEQALLTCFVISHDRLGCDVLANTNSLAHIHFIDGAQGGYAMAAKALKSQYETLRQ